MRKRYVIAAIVAAFVIVILVMMYGPAVVEA